MTDTEIIASAFTSEELRELREGFSPVKEVRIVVKERTGYSVPLAKIREFIETRRAMLPHWAECE